MTDRAHPPALPGRPLPVRLWQFQKERFPLFLNAAVAAALAVGMPGYVSAAAGRPALPDWPVALVVGLTLLGQLVQMRIADELKDAPADGAFRPYRPVPRGLVAMHELLIVAGIVAALQLAANVVLDFAHGTLLTPWLLLVWAWFALMTVEFFAKKALRRRPVTYLATHAAILPLMALYAAAAAGLGALDLAGWASLGLLLAAVFGHDAAFDIGRKLRTPAREETGVETFSRLWGLQRASLIWWLVLAATGAIAVWAGARIGWPLPVAIAAPAMAAIAGLAALWLALWTSPAASRLPRPISWLWLLVTLACLGIYPVMAGSL